MATMAIDARAELRASNYQIPHGHAANSSATPFNATNATRGAEDPFPHATTGAPLTLVEAEPAEACEPLHDRDGRLGGAVVLVKRGVCSFDVKQRHVAAAGGVAVVVANTQHGLTAMRAADAGKALQLPVVSVTTTAGQELRKAVREAQAAFSAVQVRFQGDDRFANAWASIQDLLDRKEVRCDGWESLDKTLLTHHRCWPPLAHVFARRGHAPRRHVASCTFASLESTTQTSLMAARSGLRLSPTHTSWPVDGTHHTCHVCAHHTACAHAHCVKPSHAQL